MFVLRRFLKACHITPPKEKIRTRFAFIRSTKQREMKFLFNHLQSITYPNMCMKTSEQRCSSMPRSTLSRLRFELNILAGTCAHLKDFLFSDTLLDCCLNKQKIFFTFAHVLQIFCLGYRRENSAVKI